MFWYSFSAYAVSVRLVGLSALLSTAVKFILQYNLFRRNFEGISCILKNSEFSEWQQVPPVVDSTAIIHKDTVKLLAVVASTTRFRMRCINAVWLKTVMTLQVNQGLQVAGPSLICIKFANWTIQRSVLLTLRPRCATQKWSNRNVFSGCRINFLVDQNQNCCLNLFSQKFGHLTVARENASYLGPSLAHPIHVGTVIRLLPKVSWVLGISHNQHCECQATVMGINCNLLVGFKSMCDKSCEVLCCWLSIQ